MEEFEFIKSISASAGIIIFGTFFIVMVIWVLRPSAKKKFEDVAKSIINEDKTNG